MNTVVIYRRDSISIAYTDGKEYSGCNFNVWYGYTSENTNNDMIIDANVIKREMKDDLSAFDHCCINASNIRDISVVMCEVADKIFWNAVQKNRTSIVEVIVEDCYGNYVVVDKNGVTITNKFLRDKNTNEIFFLSNDTNRINLFGRDVSSSVVSYKKLISIKELRDILFSKYDANIIPNQIGLYVSEIDLATNIVTTTIYDDNDYNYKCYTITCVEHFSHQLQIPNESGKCGRLHGHSYICRVTILDVPDLENHLIKLNDFIRELLRNALTGGCKVTTCENIISFLSKALYNDYKVIQIELKETNNIKVVKYLNDIG